MKVIPIVLVISVILGCGAQIESPKSDSATSNDSALSDTALNECQQKKGVCVPLTSAPVCPNGYSITSGVSYSCGGVGSTCCLPLPTKDAGL